MRIKKIYQGELPENKIVNEKLDSQTDTYSCDYINNLSFEGGNGVDELPIDSIIEYEGETVPEGWELVEGSESGERNYIQCELTDRLNVPDSNYVLVPFNNNLIMGGAFTYDTNTNEVVIDPKSNIDKVKIHFHSVISAGGEQPVSCFEVLVYRNDEIALIANESMELGTSRTAVSVDRVVECVPGDRFRVEIKSYDNIFILLNTYGRTVFSLEDMTNVTVNNVTVEAKEKQPSAITAVYKPISGSSNWTVPETAVATKYPINTVQSQIGDGLTLDTENNNIVVGKGISAVMVLVKSTYLSDATGTDHSWATYINHNDASMAQSTFGPAANTFMNINNSVMLNVQEGDTINLSFYGEQGDQVGRNKNTNITVFEIPNTNVISASNEYAIIERGETATGTYTKYADGRMEWEGSIQIEQIPCNNQIGSLYRCQGNTYGNVEYGVTFKEIPKLYCNVKGNYPIMLASAGNNGTITSTGYLLIVHYQSEVVWDEIFHYRAIGKWK